MIPNNTWTHSTAVMPSASQLRAVSPHSGSAVIASLYKNCFHLTAVQQLNAAFLTPIFQFDAGYSDQAFQYVNLIPHLEATYDFTVILCFSRECNDAGADDCPNTTGYTLCHRFPTKDDTYAVRGSWQATRMLQVADDRLYRLLMTGYI
jgi:hypothetical protein